MHGHYDGTSREFDVQIWDANRRLVYIHSYPYDEFFEQGLPGSWADIPMPDLNLSGDFYVVVTPNSELGGSVLYVHSDLTPPFDDRSYFVDAGTRQDYEGPYDDRDWLIRAVGHLSPATPTPAPREIAYDDGSKEGEWTVQAPVAAAVQFTPPGQGWWLTEVRIYGSYFGDSGEFSVAAWDSALRLVYQDHFAYASYFKRGVWSWASVPLPMRLMDGDFYIAVMPDTIPGLHGLSLGLDTSQPAAGRSYDVYFDTGDTLAGPYTDRSWMIRVRGELRGD